MISLHNLINNKIQGKEIETENLRKEKEREEELRKKKEEDAKKKVEEALKLNGNINEDGNKGGDN